MGIASSFWVQVRPALIFPISTLPVVSLYLFLYFVLHMPTQCFTLAFSSRIFLQLPAVTNCDLYLSVKCIISLRTCGTERPVSLEEGNTIVSARTWSSLHWSNGIPCTIYTEKTSGLFLEWKQSSDKVPTSMKSALWHFQSKLRMHLIKRSRSKVKEN